MRVSWIQKIIDNCLTYVQPVRPSWDSCGKSRPTTRVTTRYSNCTSILYTPLWASWKPRFTSSERPIRPYNATWTLSVRSWPPASPTYRFQVSVLPGNCRDLSLYSQSYKIFLLFAETHNGATLQNIDGYFERLESLLNGNCEQSLRNAVRNAISRLELIGWQSPPSNTTSTSLKHHRSRHPYRK